MGEGGDTLSLYDASKRIVKRKYTVFLILMIKSCIICFVYIYIYIYTCVLTLSWSFFEKIKEEVVSLSLTKILCVCVLSVSFVMPI